MSWNDLATAIPHWCEAVGALLGLFKLIVLMGRHLERFDATVDTVKDHGELLKNHEGRIVKIEYSKAGAKHIFNEVPH
jgi:hypothetical protein